MANEQWIHERDYGENASGGILFGLLEIVVGLFQLAGWAWRHRRD